MSETKLSGYIMRDYEDETEVVTLQSVGQFSNLNKNHMVFQYGFKDVLTVFSDLRIKADKLGKFFFEVQVSVDVGETLPGRITVGDLEELNFVNLSYASKELNAKIGSILGYEPKRNRSKNIIYSLSEIEKLHRHDLFNHIDVIVFPHRGRELGKPESLAVLFSAENITDITVTNPNKGNPFEVVLPEEISQKKAVNA